MTTHTDLIARLRAYHICTVSNKEAADALEALEQQVASLNEELQKRDKCSYMGPMRDCPTHGIGPELAAAQAREAKLRDAAKAVLEVGMGSDFEALNAALALPTDDSALRDALKAEREKLLAEIKAGGAHEVHRNVMGVRWVELRYKLPEGS